QTAQPDAIFELALPGLLASHEDDPLALPRWRERHERLIGLEKAHGRGAVGLTHDPPLAGALATLLAVEQITVREILRDALAQHAGRGPRLAAAVERHPEDVRRPAANGHEGDRAPIGRARGRLVAASRAGEGLGVAAV